MDKNEDFNSMIAMLAGILKGHVYTKECSDPLQFIKNVVVEIEKTQKENTELRAVVDKLRKLCKSAFNLSCGLPNCRHTNGRPNVGYCINHMQLKEATEVARKDSE